MNKEAHHLRYFSVENYRSIKDEQKLYFKNNRVVALYGANASGKTNILKALRFVKWFIANSANADIEQIPYEPFKLNTNTRTAPSVFTLEFETADQAFRYQFAVNATGVVDEEMTDLSSSRPKLLFKRTTDGLGENAAKYGFGKSLFGATRPGTLIITKAQENNNQYAGALFGLMKSLRVLTIGDSGLKNWGVKIMKENPGMRDRVKEYLLNADLRIRDFEVNELDMPQEVLDTLPFNDAEKNKIKSRRIIFIGTKHAVRNNDGEIVDYEMLDMQSDESAGTNNFFDMIVPIIDTIDKDAILYIDEFGSSLHPDLAEMIIKIFKSAKNSRAQLIVNTHDSGLMKEGVLDPEEIFFIEKAQYENSIITPLRDARAYRNSDKTKVEKRYKSGLYGAVPRMGEYTTYAR